MAFRQALKLAAWGLAGGSAAVLFSAGVVGKPRGAVGGSGSSDSPCSSDSEPRRSGPDSEPRRSGPDARTLAERLCPEPNGGVWDNNWDKRDPQSLISPKKKGPATGDWDSREELTNTKASRHIFLIRHTQYNVKGTVDRERTLTELGREQAEYTATRLASFGVKFDQIVHSSMTRAIETADIITRYLPDVYRASTDLLREGAPIEPDPPLPEWKPDEQQYYEDGARIEAAFRHFIHRADAKQKEDSYEILVCHANVIRYMICRALQFPPEGWLRICVNNGSITHLTVFPSGRVVLRTLGDSGFMPLYMITYN